MRLSIFLLLLTFYTAIEARRGGGSRGSSSRGSSSRSRGSSSSSKSSGKGLFSSLFGGGSKSKKPSTSASYPKQTGSYPKQSSTGGIPPAGTYGSNFGSNSQYGFNSFKGNTNFQQNGFGSSGPYSKYNKFTGNKAFGTALGGSVFGKTYPSSSYLSAAKSNKNLRKGGVALGAGYIGYKGAKAAGKLAGSVGKAYLYSMYRPRMYYGNDYYSGLSYYYYRGRLSPYCDIWYNSREDREEMRCNEGCSYNYEREFDSISETVRDDDWYERQKTSLIDPYDPCDQKYQSPLWNSQDKMRLENDEFNKANQVYYEKRYSNNLPEYARNIIGGALIFFLIFGCCACSFVLYGVYHCMKGAKEVGSTHNSMSDVNIPMQEGVDKKQGLPSQNY